jgi:hypothetical protein
MPEPYEGSGSEEEVKSARDQESGNETIQSEENKLDETFGEEIDFLRTAN